MKFTKMHGCGNDYIYINGFQEKIVQKEKIIPFLSDRHFGIGGDGVIFINPSPIADFEMETYNADGSRAEMCGNGIRCVAKYVYDKGLTDKTVLTIESMGKIKEITLSTENGTVKTVRVDMGEPELMASKIPVVSNQERVVGELIEVNGEQYPITCVSMGNPHAVVFLQDTDQLKSLDSIEIEKIGPKFENHSKFPNRINTEFVEVIDRNHVAMRVWERGTGETLACGTGCCATAVASVLNDLTERKITVSVLGGEIEIEWNQETNHVIMSGPATIVFEGEIDCEN